MAKVTITLEDTDHGTVTADVKFDPPLQRDDITDAQRDAIDALSAVFTLDDLTGIDAGAGFEPVG